MAGAIGGARARRPASCSASTKPRSGRARCTCGSNARPTAGPDRGRRRRARSRRRRGLRGGDQTDNRTRHRVRTAGRREAVARRRASPSPWGSWGRCSRAAFIIPLIIGVNAPPARARARRRRSRCCSPASACSRWGGSSRSTRSASTRRARSTTTCRTGLGPTIGAAAGWLYYAGTIILTTGLGVLIGGYVHDNLLPARSRSNRPADLGVGRHLWPWCCSWSSTSACRSRPACS